MEQDSFSTQLAAGYLRANVNYRPWWTQTWLKLRLVLWLEQQHV